ncbi:MAG: hypothetical protein WCE90_03965 [Candidatus Zixiibacteriota bacterium]
MEIGSLIESLKEHSLCILEEKMQKIDFDQLEKDLGEAASALGCLEQRGKLCEKLLADFKSEIKRMALVVSRAKGDLTSCSLVEKFMSSPDLGYEDLQFLREKVREEFNQSFPSRPQSKAMVDLSDPHFGISEFKAGVGANPRACPARQG